MPSDDLRDGPELGRASLWFSRQCHPSGLDQLDQPVGPHQFEEVVDLTGIAGDLETDRVGSHIDRDRVEDRSNLEDFSSLPGAAGNSHEHDLALDRVSRVEFGDLHNVDELVKLLLDLL